MALLDAFAMVGDDDDRRSAFARWQPDLLPSERAGLIVEQIATSADADSRLNGFAALGLLDPDAAAPHVRQLLDTSSSGHAALFLLDNGLAAAEEVDAFLEVAPFVDLLSTLVDVPDSLCELFAEALATGPDSDEMLADMWHHPEPETVAVLDALGKHMPDKKLAKAARKAAMQHRSWMANRR